MENIITIRSACTESDIETFWAQLHAYQKRDLFPESDSEDLAYFLSDEYRAQIQSLHDRTENRLYYLFFSRDGQDIGFAMPVIYKEEDGKCFIMEFCVYPAFRGGGTGRQCAAALLAWAAENGAEYSELNYGGHADRLRFWKSMGFISNGADEWGEPLLLLPPKKDVPITVTILRNTQDWQLLKLENGFLSEIGEEPMDEEKQERLRRAIENKEITFFLAKRGCRAVGMCSVVRCFSTFACSDIGVFDDFFVEPAFRKKGIARTLTQAAQNWSRENGLPSLTVCCAPCDEGMYQALGFDVRLGSTYANIL